MSDSAQESQKRHFSKIRPHVLARPRRTESIHQKEVSADITTYNMFLLLYSRRGLSRFELHKNEPKKLKRLSRTQNVHCAAANNFWPRSSATPGRSGGPAWHNGDRRERVDRLPALIEGCPFDAGNPLRL